MRIAIVGCGGSGLSCIKACVEGGLEPVCFERTGHMGGLWYYTDNPVSGQASVMKTTVMNTCKEVMAFGDFPPPAEWPPYLTHKKVLKYFRMYMNHFDLDKYIRYNTETVFVKKTKNYSSTGQWEVTLKDLTTQKEWTEIFDGVMTATGHHAIPHKPSYPGQELFKGQIYHSHDIRDVDKYRDKRVLVVGTGNSGGDCAVELSYRNQVYLSSRNGFWIYHRIGIRGWPVDMTIQRRLLFYFLKKEGTMVKLFGKISEQFLSVFLDHEAYGIRPSYGPSSEHPLINDALPNRIGNGTVVVKTGIKRFTKTGVEFTDGSSVDNIDMVVMATGYLIDFPYIDKKVVDIKDNNFPMYKLIYPPDLEHPTLALIGCFQPRGSIPNISEMQARVAVQVFKGVTKLPSRDEMIKDIEDRNNNLKYLHKSLRHTITVDPAPYMDELMKMIGAKPKIWKLFFTDPILAWNLLVGSTLTYQYRLQGPNAWSGSRDAVLNKWKRLTAGLQKNRQVPERTDRLLQKHHYFFFWIMVMIVIVFKLFC